MIHVIIRSVEKIVIVKPKAIDKQEVAGAVSKGSSETVPVS